MKVFPLCLFPIAAWAMPAFATVTVTSPTAGALVPSPVHFVATATAPTCAKGVASMGIYVNNVRVYAVKGAVLNTSITMANGPEHTTVEEWDNCSGATVAHIDIFVGPPTIAITSNPPTIQAGSSSTLTVTAAHATQVTIAGSDGT